MRTGTDRRVNRTELALRRAFLQLIAEREYSAIREHTSHRLANAGFKFSTWRAADDALCAQWLRSR